MSDQLYLNVRHAVARAKEEGDLTHELEDSKIGLTAEDSQVVTDLIDILSKINEKRGIIIELIRVLVVVVESIQGKGKGEFKKEEAQKLFTDILSLMDISQRDRKFYLSIFDNAVELIFWGRDWVKDGGWSRFKTFVVNTFTCGGKCKCCC